ncbi:MAG: hypothetical protein DI535_16530 [Citrobacter freundii]|nr:MAG: hypothetical protein DI535_16530 [Citrobacter freundii]
MNRILFPVFTLCLLQLLFACKNSNTASNNVLTIANEALLNSIASTESATENVLLAFQEKKADPFTADKAKFFEPTLLTVDNQANDLVSRIERIKDEVWKERNNRTVSGKILKQTDSLPAMILSFRNFIRQTNPYLAGEAKRKPILFAEKFDQQIINGESVNKLLFESTSPLETTLLLSRFQLSIRELALGNAVTLLENTARRSLICTFIMPLISQSHQVLRPNGQLTLDIALGEIRYNGLQKVTANGKEVPQDEKGICKATFTAPATPGKYSIPVVASYTDQDGKEWMIKKDIQYEVTACEGKDK